MRRLQNSVVDDKVIGRELAGQLLRVEPKSVSSSGSVSGSKGDNGRLTSIRLSHWSGKSASAMMAMASPIWTCSAGSPESEIMMATIDCLSDSAVWVDNGVGASSSCGDHEMGQSSLYYPRSQPE